ncbi:MAG: hypothetical protein WC619_01580 [Patescibacteria group bacterium]
MDKQIFKNKLKEQLKQIGWRAITTVILTLTAVITVWAYAAFTEPLAGPNNSDQDFLQNILGANNNDNDFDSSNVVLNKDGSIIERLEYVQGQGSTTPTCGNSVLEAGENCDDGGTSWTSGACAADCSRRNYWSNPMIQSETPFASNVNSICQLHGFNSVAGVSYSSFASTIDSAGGFVTQISFLCGYPNNRFYSSSYITSYSLLVTTGFLYTGTNYVWALSTSSSQTASVAALLTSSTIETYTYNPWTCYTYYYSLSSSYKTSFRVSQLWCAD